MAYITIPDLKRYLRIDQNDENNDQLLQDCIDAAQARVDEICHRTFEAPDDTTRYFDLSRDVRRRTIYFDTDLCQITRVENDGREIDESQYFLEPRNDTPYYALTLRYNSERIWSYSVNGPEDAIKITGRWAYSVEAPETVKQATRRLAGFYYQETSAQVFEAIGPADQGQAEIPTTEPGSFRQILKRYKRPASVRRRFF